MPVFDRLQGTLYQANIAPQFVQPYATKDTFDDINKSLEAEQGLAASIKRDPVLNPDAKANYDIYQGALNTINKAAEAGNIHYRDKYLAVKKLASAYANDPTRAAQLKSVGEREAITKQLDEVGNQVYKDYTQTVNDEQYQGAKELPTGGFQTYAHTSIPVVKYVNPLDISTKVGSGFQVEGDEQAGYYVSDGQGHRVQVSQSKKGVVPEEVRNLAASAWEGDREFNASQMRDAEILAVNSIRNNAAKQGIAVNSAQARQLALNPNYQQDYVERVAKINSKGELIDENNNVIQDAKGNLLPGKNVVMEDKAFKANPLQYAAFKKREDFIKNTTAKFSGFDTKFKVDERDDAFALARFKKTLAEEDTSIPQISVAEEQETGFALPAVEVDEGITDSPEELEGAVKFEEKKIKDFVSANITGKPYNQIAQDKLNFMTASLEKAKSRYRGSHANTALDETTQGSLKFLGYDPATIKNRGEAKKIVDAWNTKQKNYTAQNLQLGTGATENLTEIVKAGGLKGGDLYIPSLNKTIPLDELFSGDYKDIIKTTEKGKDLSVPEQQEAFYKDLSSAKIALSNTKHDLRSGINARFALNLNGREVQIVPNPELNEQMSGIAALKRQEHDPTYHGTAPKPIPILMPGNVIKNFRGIYDKGEFKVQVVEDGKWKDYGRNVETLAKDVLQVYRKRSLPSSGLGKSKKEQTLEE